MDGPTTQLVVETLAEAGVDLIVTLPEEPSHSVIDATRLDSRFQTITVTNESDGIALCGGASLSGRKCVFVTGVAGLMVGTWAIAQMSMVFGAPFTIIASYRGDFGDATGIPGSQLLLFRRIAEPLLQTLNVPYQIVNKKSEVRQALKGGITAAHDFEQAVAVLFTGEVLE